MSRAGQRKIDRGIVSVCMGEVKSHVMVRRPGCAPYVLSAKEWDALQFEGQSS